MKKILAIVLALTALLALSVTALAAADAVTEASPRASREMKTDIEAAVSEEEAVAAALKDAGLAGEDVTVTRTRLREKTDENGETVAVYIIRFRTGDMTYKYTVDANTGAVVDSTVTEGVSEGRGRGESSGGKVSGEPSGEATREPGGEASGERGARGSGRAGRGNKAASAEADAAPVLTDTTAA